MGLATEQIQNASSIGERKLWCFVLHCAVAAVKKNIPGAIDYFYSEQFVTVAAFLSLNVDWLRQQALSDRPMGGEEVNMIYLIDPNPKYRIEKRARAKSRLAESRLAESSDKGQWITGPGVIVESGVQLAN